MLAPLEPAEEWTIRKGPEHTTVINRICTRVFDLIYWTRALRLAFFELASRAANRRRRTSLAWCRLADLDLE